MRWSGSTWSPSPKRSTESPSVDEIALEIVLARGGRTLLDANDLKVDPVWAYHIQHRVRAISRSNQVIVGFKLGYTSDVMRKAMGIDEPNHGALAESMVADSPAKVAGLIQPKVEPEIAARVRADGSVIELLASLEVVDSVWRNYAFTWAQNTSDGSSAAFAVLGAPLESDIEHLSVTLQSSSGESRAARLRDTCPDVDDSLRWLAGHLDLPRTLRNGDVVLTGGLTAPLDLEPDGWISARFDAPGWSTEVRVDRQESA